MRQCLIDAMSDEDRKALGLLSTKEREQKIEAKKEKELQSYTENWLKQRGYWPRTPAFLDGRTPPKGWFIHYNPLKTKGNPIILDLLIWTVGGRVLELELKKIGGKPREHQQVILDTTDCAKIAYGFEEVVKIVDEWEKATGAP